MRRKRSLIILLAALVLMVGVYAYLASRPQDVDDQDDSEPVVSISSFDSKKITSITLKNSNADELVFETETRAVEVEGSDGKKETKEETVWVSKKPYSVKLSESKLLDLAKTFSSLTAELVVEENPADLAKYGLDKPSATGIAQLNDGSKVTLLLGNKTAEGNTYYLMKDGDPKVYTVLNTHGQRLLSAFSDFRDKSLTTIDITNLTYMHLTGEGRREIEIVSSDDLPNKDDAYGYTGLFLIKPFKRPRGLDLTKLNPTLEKIAAFSIKEFADDNPTDLAKYGLDNPRLHLVIRDNKNTLDLSFGNSRDDGTVYFKTGDSNAVYLMDEESFSSLDIDPMNISDKFTLLVNIEDVNKIVLEGRGIKHTFTITRTVKEGEEDKTIGTYYMDGKEVKENAFKRFYQSLIGIMVDVEKAHTAQGIPEFKLTYYLNENKYNRELSLALYPYENDYYSVVREGDMESEFLVYKNRLDWVFNDLNDFISGKFDEE